MNNLNTKEVIKKVTIYNFFSSLPNVKAKLIQYHFCYRDKEKVDEKADEKISNASPVISPKNN